MWATSILSRLSSADLLLPSSLASCIIYPVIKAAGLSLPSFCANHVAGAAISNPNVFLLGAGGRDPGHR